MERSGISTLFYAVAFTVLVGYLMIIGASIIIPIVWAIIIVYVLNRADAWLVQRPLVGGLPQWMRRVIILGLFTVIVVSLVGLTISNFSEIANSLPVYQENLRQMIVATTTAYNIPMPENLQVLQERLAQQINLSELVLGLVNSLANAGSWVFLVIIYAAFLMGETSSLVHKTQIAFAENAESSLDLFHRANQRIGDYLAVKTLINIILACASFVIMFMLGVDYAFFWALTIGILNYIPYVGSLLGVVFPVLLTLAQFGSLGWAILVGVLLTCAQLFVGNVLEPRLIGKSVNLSGFVVLVALVVWMALWGLHGAILSVPLTSMLMIVLAANPSTRFIAVFLSSDGDVSS